MQSNSPKAEVLRSVQRASAQAALAVHGEMKRGLHSLASIAFSASLVGVLGTLFAIFGCFVGTTGDRWSIYLILMGKLSEALIPMEMGLLVAVLAFCGHRYFRARLDELDAEMEIASLQLLEQLASVNKVAPCPGL